MRGRGCWSGRAPSAGVSECTKYPGLSEHGAVARSVAGSMVGSEACSEAMHNGQIGVVCGGVGAELDKTNGPGHVVPGE